ncbi:MAG: putative 4-mercaptohistidine N1-methyltransferase, partial [Aeromonadaceae bacterium]
WDNEYGQQQVELAPFQASRMLVSNAEYLGFVEAGGYGERRWWSEEGWRWREFAQATQPCFWVGSGEDLKLRLMNREVVMPWDWPVEVNQLEAEAFCRWQAERTGLPVQLPCEAEWYQLRDSLPVDQPDWERAPGNINLEKWASSCPVDHFAHGEFFDLLGNVWQWSRSTIAGFDGFRVHPLYDDFSTPTFDGKHALIKGGSWISTGNLAIRASRYAFRRHFFQHAGFRYVVSSHQEASHANPYLQDEQVAWALEAAYGETLPGLEHPALVLSRLAARLQPAGGKALDMGCGVGRSTLELARHFSQVEGVDVTARFIDVALMLQQQGQFAYQLPWEGELQAYREARLSPLGLNGGELAGVTFSQGDACNLKPKYQGYDLVLASDLLDELRDPGGFLREMAERLKPGGVLILSCGYQWQEAKSPKRHWLGGVRENGEALGSYRALQCFLAPWFEELEAPSDLPVAQRLNGRAFDYRLLQVTCWRRRG